MKRILTIILPLLFAACTHNNGDIGHLFGSWVLTSMTVDGEAVEEPYPDADTFLMFQGKIAMVRVIDDRSSLLTYRMATWTREGNIIALDFTHRDDDNGPGTSIYEAPAWLMLTNKAVNDMQILSLTSGNMHLRHVTPDGDIVEYKFRKTF